MKKIPVFASRLPCLPGTFIKFEPVTTIHVRWECPTCNKQFILNSETDTIITCDTCDHKFCVSPDLIIKSK